MTERIFDYDPVADLFTLKVSPRENERAKMVMGMRFHKPSECWRAKPYLSTAHAVRGVFGTDITVTQAAKDAVREEAATATLVQRFKDGFVPEPVHPVMENLLPWQPAAVLSAVAQGGFLNGDEKGNGKTIEALRALHMTGAYPALVVATNSMKLTWGDEVSKWTGATPIVAGRTAKNRTDAIAEAQSLSASGQNVVLIMGWSQILKHTRLAAYGSTARSEAEKQDKELNGGWLRTVIADEAHKAKDPKSKQTRALWALGHDPAVVNRWPLTATPIANQTLDLWSILHFMDPGRWPSRSQFRDRYVLTYVNHWGGVEDLGLDPTNEAEFFKIINPFYIRRPLQIKDVSLLPVQYRMLEMEPKQATAYKQFKKDMLVAADSESGGKELLIATNPLVLNTYLQTLAAATPVLNDEGRIVELTMPSCKVSALQDLLEEMGGEPLVVFSESRKLIELAHREITKGKSPQLAADKIGLVTGQVSDTDRHLAVSDFQAGRLPLILLTLGAGSEGITLTRSNTAAYLNRSYKMVANNQADGRLFRTGQTRDVQLIEFVTRGTVESAVHEATGGKEEMLQQFVKDPDWQRRVLSA